MIGIRILYLVDGLEQFGTRLLFFHMLGPLGMIIPTGSYFSEG